MLSDGNFTSDGFKLIGQDFFYFDFIRTNETNQVFWWIDLAVLLGTAEFKIIEQYILSTFDLGSIKSLSDAIK